MKSYLTALFSAIAVLLTLGSCTQNGGDIGPIFGSWHLTEVTVDGEPLDGFNDDDTFFSFQKNIVQVTRTFPHHEFLRSYGTWRDTDSGDDLELTFTYTSSDPASEVSYMAPTWIGFPQQGVFTLRYLSKPSSTGMKLEWIDSEGKTYVYTFKKTH